MSPTESLNSQAITAKLAEAAELIAQADAILIAAGAGIGVDSSLPDFRGNSGFWKAYPQFKKCGRTFSDAANGDWFHREPRKAWGFYAHRLNLYRSTSPHAGFKILKNWCETKNNYFIYTSNVDGHFQKAGFSHSCIYEVHGSIHHLQCTTDDCTDEVWPLDASYQLDVDNHSLELQNEMPCCSHGHMARPNILMFDDWCYINTRSKEQYLRYQEWKKSNEGQQVVTLEIGAGNAIPTVRNEARIMNGVTIRINPDSYVSQHDVLAIPAGAQSVLSAIDKCFKR
jgi:NAD-dependent SIR2 family protein deacetylase